MTHIEWGKGIDEPNSYANKKVTHFAHWYRNGAVADNGKNSKKCLTKIYKYETIKNNFNTTYILK